MIIRLTGGLGNQMFQYAFGRSASIEKKCELFLDISGFEKTYAGNTPRTYALSTLNVRAKIAPPEKIAPHTNIIKDTWNRIIRKLYPEKPYTFDEGQLRRAHCDSYLTGLWQNEKYFIDIAETIREEFLPKDLLSSPAERIHERIRVSNHPVSVHIRRGDYVSNKNANTHHGLLPLSYYKDAFEYIMNHVGSHFTACIFSDDIEWVRAHATEFIPEGADTVFVSANNIPDHEELTLMRTCKHHVIANSSFSWWGAWLNPHKEKIVIAPKHWVSDPQIDTGDVTPASWIRM